VLEAEVGQSGVIVPRLTRWARLRCPTPRLWAWGVSGGAGYGKQIHERLVSSRGTRGRWKGARCGWITTVVVETDIHYPNRLELVGDGGWG